MDSSISDDPKAPDLPGEAEVDTAPVTEAEPTGDQEPPTTPQDALGAAEPAPDALSVPAAPEGQEDAAQGEAVEAPGAEDAAARGPWNPSATPLKVGTLSYPVWDLVGGWVGTRIGDSVHGVHLTAPHRVELADKVRNVINQRPA
jgi:hypothetical protein